MIIEILLNLMKLNKTIILFKSQKKVIFKYKSIFISHRTIIWLGEEIHKVNCEQNILLVNMVILFLKDLKLFRDLFSKTSGIVTYSTKK
jgi:hypothetical protein